MIIGLSGPLFFSSDDYMPEFDDYLTLIDDYPLDFDDYQTLGSRLFFR